MYQIILMQKGGNTLKSMTVKYPINLKIIIPFNDDDSQIQVILKDNADQVISSIGVPIEKSFIAWESIEAFYIGQEISSVQLKNEKIIGYISENKWRIRIFLFAIGIITISLIVKGISDITKGQGLAIFSGISLLLLMVLLLVFVSRVARNINKKQK